jgi:hypothetical protein
LPRAVRIGKEELDREPLGQLLVLGHLCSSIIRQGFPQQGGAEKYFSVLLPALCLHGEMLEGG